MASLTLMSSSKTPNEFYREMDKISKERIRDDLMYRLIVGGDDILNEITTAVVDELFIAYPTMSMRLKSILIRMRESTDNSNRVLKHGLLFFALANEPWAIDIVSTRGKIPPKRYDLFYRESLIPCSHKLLNGVLTSLHAFVEEMRGEYIIS